MDNLHYLLMSRIVILAIGRKDAVREFDVVVPGAQEIAHLRNAFSIPPRVLEGQPADFPQVSFIPCLICIDRHLLTSSAIRSVPRSVDC
jgi:hypothetical protein